MSDEKPKRKRTIPPLTIQQRMDIVNRAREIGTKEAVKECSFPLDMNTLYTWIRSMDDYEKMDPEMREKKRKIGVGKKPYLSTACEARLAEWIQVNKESGIAIKFETIQELLMQWKVDGLLEFHAQFEGNIPEINFSRKWFKAFCKRNNIEYP